MAIEINISDLHPSNALAAGELRRAARAGGHTSARLSMYGHHIVLHVGADGEGRECSGDLATALCWYAGVTR